MRTEAVVLAGVVWYGVSLGTAVAQPADGLALTVLVVDQASRSRSIVERAEGAAARVFTGIGIHVEWTNIYAGEPYWEGTYNLKVNMVATPKQRQTGWELGFANRSKGTRNVQVHVFYDRIEALAQLNGISIEPLLGHVLAHELAHLLLPNGSHSASGIMSKRWRREHFQDMEMGALTFASDEAERIRTRVRSMTISR